MLIALNRRVPRTKSTFERTSSRRYSSFDCDSNGYYDTSQDSLIIENHRNGNHREKHFNSIPMVLLQTDYDDHDDEMTVSSNGCDAVSILLDDEDNSDEYALLYFYKTLLSFPLAQNFCVFFFCTDIASATLFLLFHLNIAHLS